MDGITQEQTLIVYVFPEKRKEDGWCRRKEPTQQKLWCWRYVKKVKKIHWYKLLGHTGITQTQHYFRQLRILRSIFKVRQS